MHVRRALHELRRRAVSARRARSATDIVPGSGPARNIFIVHRRGPYSRRGTLWREGKTTLASRGLGGQPANGDSWDPVFDGYDYAHGGREHTVAPRCVAFVSNASNLVPGDTDGRADVFVEHLKTGRLMRISAPAPASEVALDGRCFTIASVAGGTVYIRQIRHGSGKVRRVSGLGNASSPDLSANGKLVTYSRNGFVYVNRHRVTAGTDPSADQWGRFVAFNRGAQLWQANIKGAAHPHRIHSAIHRRDHQKVMNGVAPSMTAGGHFVFFAAANVVDSNVYERFASCPIGSVTQLVGSPHGNYAVYACSSGQAFMAYVGGR